MNNADRRQAAKSDRERRLSEAFDRIAACIEYGELMLATDQPKFFEAVADRLEAITRRGVTDEELGRSIRAIAAATSADFDHFDHYADAMVMTAARLADGSWSPGKVARVQVRVEPTDQIDGLLGLLGRVVEMIVGVPCGTANMRGDR